MNYCKVISSTPAIPDFQMSEIQDGKDAGSRYFTEPAPGEVYRNVSPDDPRAQLGWLDARIDKVSGVLKQLVAWRLEVTQRQPPGPVIFYAIPYTPDKQDWRTCGACGASVLLQNTDTHYSWHSNK